MATGKSTFLIPSDSGALAKEIWRMVSVIRETGMATILVDKNFEAITEISTRNLIMIKGKIVFEGSGSELKADPEKLRHYLGV